MKYSPKDILFSYENGCIPCSLLNGWEKEAGYDPIKRVRNLIEFRAAGLKLLASGAGISLFLASAAYGLYPSYVQPILITESLFLFSAIATGFILLAVNWLECRRFASKPGEFGYDLGEFLSVLGLSLGGALLYEKELPKSVQKTLDNFGANLRYHEAQERFCSGTPAEVDYAKYAEEAKEGLKRVFRLMVRFTLADKKVGWGPHARVPTPELKTSEQGA